MGWGEALSSVQLRYIVGKNKCFDQGTVLLHRGVDEAGCLVFASKETPGATEPAP